MGSFEGHGRFAMFGWKRLRKNVCSQEGPASRGGRVVYREKYSLSRIVAFENSYIRYAIKTLDG